MSLVFHMFSCSVSQAKRISRFLVICKILFLCLKGMPYEQNYSERFLICHFASAETVFSCTLVKQTLNTFLNKRHLVKQGKVTVNIVNTKHKLPSDQSRVIDSV